MRCIYASTPLVVVGTLVLLSLPWLGLIALMIVAPVVLVALGAFAWAFVFVPYVLSRAIGRLWQMRGEPNSRTAALSPTETPTRVARDLQAPHG